MQACIQRMCMGSAAASARAGVQGPRADGREVEEGVVRGDADVEDDADGE